MRIRTKASEFNIILATSRIIPYTICSTLKFVLKQLIDFVVILLGDRKLLVIELALLGCFIVMWLTVNTFDLVIKANNSQIMNQSMCLGIRTFKLSVVLLSTLLLSSDSNLLFPWPPTHALHAMVFEEFGTKLNSILHTVLLVFYRLILFIVQIGNRANADKRCGISILIVPTNNMAHAFSGLLCGLLTISTLTFFMRLICTLSQIGLTDKMIKRFGVKRILLFRFDLSLDQLSMSSRA